MPSTQNAVNNHEYRSVPITALAESATNPRKRFDAKSLEELADYMPGHISCCVVSDFVADDAKRRTGISVHVSKGHITCDSRDLMYIRCVRTCRGCQTRLNLNFLFARYPPTISK